MYIVEPEVEPHPNLIRKFEPESNLILAEPELEPEPCDIGNNIHHHRLGPVSVKVLAP